jgi:hypothetical protein
MGKTIILRPLFLLQILFLYIEKLLPWFLHVTNNTVACCLRKYLCTLCRKTFVGTTDPNILYSLRGLKNGKKVKEKWK